MTRIIEDSQDADANEKVFELRVFQLHDGDVRACLVPLPPGHKSQHDGRNENEARGSGVSRRRPARCAMERRCHNLVDSRFP